MVNLDKYRNEVERIKSEPDSTLSQPDLIEHRKQLLKIFEDIFGTEWLDGERVEKGETSASEDDEIILQYEAEVDEMASQFVSDLSVQELRRQRRRLIEIFEEIIENQESDEDTVIDDDDDVIDDEETVL